MAGFAPFPLPSPSCFPRYLSSPLSNTCPLPRTGRLGHDSGGRRGTPPWGAVGRPLAPPIRQRRPAGQRGLPHRTRPRQGAPPSGWGGRSAP